MHPNGIDRCHAAGFTLLQVSIMLTVASLAMVSMLPGQDAGDYNQKSMTTIQKLDKVEWAMRGFMAKNGRRPCPANGQYDINSANFGLEAANPGVCTGGTPAAPFGPDAGTGYVVGGVIPTKTLNLPDEYALDEWGRRLTYVVDTRATSQNYCWPMQYGGKQGGIKIETSTGGTVLDNVMYAYISHGPDGHGAFPAQGSTVANRINTGSTDTDQLTNAGVNAAFTYSTTNFTNVKVKKDKTSTFDDIIYYQNSIKNTCELSNMPSGFRIDGAAGDELAGLAFGDVNGDGIADLIISSYNAGASSGGGNIYVIYGTKAGFPDPFSVKTLNGTNGFVLKTFSGESIHRVRSGDINADGYDDIAIGAGHTTISGKVDAGRAYVVMGGPNSTFASCTYASPCVLNTTFLNGTTGFRIDGANAGDLFGYGVAVGDVDGDGKADMVFGAQDTQSGGYTIGTAYLVWGKGTAYSSTYTINTVPSVKFLGTTTDTTYTVGNDVAMGDTRGRGQKDIIIGAYESASGVNVVGYVFVIYGASQGSFAASYTLNTTAGTLINGTKGFRLVGTSDNDLAGTCVGSGDINNDGFDDLILGVPRANSSAGYLYVVYGKSAVWGSASTALSSLIGTSTGFRINGAAGDYLGWGCGGSGSNGVTDINGDGYKDLIFGASQTGGINKGYVSVVYGKAKASWTSNNYNISTLTDGTKGFTLQGVNNGDDVGEREITGDINGDGKADIAISALLTDYGGTNAGSVYVFFGGQSSWPNPSYNLGGL